jgi:hypothetical protein
METVISVSAYNSKAKVSNGEWESILAETMIVNNGDGIVIKDAYIDTRTRSSDDIYIEEDTMLYIDYYYYYVNAYTDVDKMHVMGRSLGSGGLQLDANIFTYIPTTTEPNATIELPNPDGLPYMLMFYWYPYDVNTHSYPEIDASGNPIAKNWGPVVGVWQYLLKAGSYAKDYLATVLTKEMARVVPDKIDQGYSFDVGVSSIRRMRISNTIPNTPPKNFIIQPLIIYTGTPHTYGYYVDYNNLTLNPNNGGLPSAGNGPIPAVLMSLNNVEGRSNIAFFSETNKNPYVIFPYLRLVQNEFASTSFQGNNSLVAPTIGANEISLIYNDQNNGLYSFDYLHTPILSAGKEVVIVSTVNLANIPQAPQVFYDVAMSDRQAGIIPAKLEPASFWGDILGFDTKALAGSNLIGENLSQPNMLWADYQSVTTGNFWGISMLSDPRLELSMNGYPILFPNTFRDTIYRGYLGDGFSGPQTNKYGTIVWESDNTNMVEAVGPPLNPGDTGHFLIEITGYSTNYFDENDAYQVKSIISSYYITANSFATAPFPDSFVYEHHGEPLIIGSLKVRILNPKTKKVLPIGPNSTIYLQVTQQLTPEKVQQPDF